VVRVRPAFAGEGRYFVRVPEGTNQGLFEVDKPVEIDMKDITNCECDHHMMM
jgi:hypothetical protein